MKIDKISLLQELNQIALQEMSGLIFKQECLFCEKKSANRTWMVKHIIGHLKQCMPKCKECGQQHIPSGFWDMEEILESHTETVVI